MAADGNRIDTPAAVAAGRKPAQPVANFDELLALLERRWAMMIISRLCKRPLGFAELLRAIPAMSPQMMLLRLRELEQHGIVEKVVVVTVASKVKYGLTDSGRALRPAVSALLDWASTRGDVLHA
jgi:DNA-binding HxlR family transcriptional regulator